MVYLKSKVENVTNYPCSGFCRSGSQIILSNKIVFREFKTVLPVSSLKRESTSILHPSSLSFTGCLWNFVFNSNWLFWLSVISRVLFLHIYPLFCTFINHRVFFAHLLKNCSKFPGLTLSQPVNAHFILLPRTVWNSLPSSLRNITNFLQFKAHLKSHLFLQAVPNS